VNVKHLALDRLRTETPAIRAFKKAVSRGPRITRFPAFVFPIVRDDLDQRMERIPVSCWMDVGRLERRPDFMGWAGDPRTGEINIVIR
jgi:hypothetical protein